MEVVQLVILQHLHIVLLHKETHKLSVVKKIQPYAIRHSNNVFKHASKGSNKLVHNNKLVHKFNSNICRLVLWAVVVVAQQEEEVAKEVGAAIIEDNCQYIRIIFNNARLIPGVVV
jgi:hypothetical protein